MNRLDLIRGLVPVLILAWIGYKASELDAPIRTEPLPPAWVPLLSDQPVSPSKPPASPPPVPKRPPQPVEGAQLTGTLEVGDAFNLGDPIVITLKAENTGNITLTNVLIWLPLPQGTHTTQGARFIRLMLKEMVPGQTVKQQATLVQQVAGKLTLQARLTSKETAESKVEATLQISTAVLTVEPLFDTAARSAEQAKLCYKVTNHGGAPARNVFFRLHDLTDAMHQWDLLAPGESIEACFDLPGLEQGRYALTAEATAFAADSAYHESQLVIE